MAPLHIVWVKGDLTMEKSKTIFLVVKVLFAMYIVTGLILLLLTALLYKFDIGENVINLGGIRAV